MLGKLFVICNRGEEQYRSNERERSRLSLSRSSYPENRGSIFVQDSGILCKGALLCKAGAPGLGGSVRCGAPATHGFITKRSLRAAFLSSCWEPNRTNNGCRGPRIRRHEEHRSISHDVPSSHQKHGVVATGKHDPLSGSLSVERHVRLLRDP